MQTQELYQRILGLQAPWQVERVELKLQEGEVHVYLASQQAVGDQLQLSWDEVHGIMERAVKRGLARRKAEEIPQLGVDEKGFRKGHKYLTLINDLKRNRVLYVAEDREPSSLDGFWSTITDEQRASIRL